jgi:hypothetical protein
MAEDVVLPPLKSAARFGLLSFFFLAMLSSYSSAQYDLCTPDCPDHAWSSPKIIAVSLAPEYPGCTINVEYVERETCSANAKMDFQLTGKYSFVVRPGCEEIWNLLYADGEDAASLLKLVNKKAMPALVTNHFLTLENKPDCGSGLKVSYRTLSGRCFLRKSLSQTVMTEGTYASYATERCGDICCIWTFGACYDSQEQRVKVELVTAPGGGHNCPRTTYFPFTQCNGICFDE